MLREVRVARETLLTNLARVRSNLRQWSLRPRYWVRDLTADPSHVPAHAQRLWNGQGLCTDCDRDTDLSRDQICVLVVVQRGDPKRERTVRVVQATGDAREDSGEGQSQSGGGEGYDMCLILKDLYTIDLIPYIM